MMVIPIGPSVSLDDIGSISSFFSLSTLFSMLVVQCVPVVITGVMWAFWGTSPGKRALGLRIVDADTGYSMTTRQAAIRTLGYLICIATCGVGFLWMFFNPKKQGLHDLMAETVVVEATEIHEANFPDRPTRSDRRDR